MSEPDDFHAAEDEFLREQSKAVNRVITERAAEQGNESKHFLKRHAATLIFGGCIILATLIHSCSTRYQMHSFQGRGVIMDQWTGDIVHRF